MSRKVKSVRVPIELENLNLSKLIREFENYLRDLESATMLKQGGNRDAADALIKTRQLDLGKKIATMIWEAKVKYDKMK
ncbi:hypothetical protein [Maridesulfovibrio hydrothermalis]|uniref:Uncharacterized protein n=1 Tax=Maridesulfovibrio hydrothermalis AM13 = DSM 14728 TaxID=1121451 RepID=L0R7T4_9BACT|nr:hypothetical protein [Maridesulfovibrio hydrothermalis]CCO22799.1 conserved protein of unknown function [Maridesulfovibrio hydrothermalis AM13 = DSM 14728]